MIIINLEMENSDLDTIAANATDQETNEEKNIASQKEEISKEDKIRNNEDQCKYNLLEAEILEEIKNCPVIFQSQQRGDPELSASEKKQIANELLLNKPVTFLLRFGEFLKEEHLNYFLNKFNTSYEVEFYVKKLKNLLSDHNKNLVKRNRRYEAMKKMEAEGIYFSETEMEKREPLLYHQMVGQYLSENEKLLKNRQAQKNVIPSFSSFLIQQMEREELDKLIKIEQENEDNTDNIYSSSEDEALKDQVQNKHWGDDWEDEQSRKKIKKKQPKQEKVLSKKEKNFLLQEFKSIMINNFLNGKDIDFNYSEVDLNPDFDSVDLRAQDEEEKYFDEETNDGTNCTDTGIEDY